MKFMDFGRALQMAKEGRPFVYPTETFYAVGASALDERAANLVYAAKRRGCSYPLPVIIGGVEQLDLIAAPWTGKHSDEAEKEINQELMRLFWPGPLSLLLPASKLLPGILTGGNGRVAARVPAHAGARGLCLEAGLPLISSSANISGLPPAREPEDLDPALLSALDPEQRGIILDLPPYPGGGLPSTIVRARPDLGKKTLLLLRHGAIGRPLLEKHGFTCVEKGKR